MGTGLTAAAEEAGCTSLNIMTSAGEAAAVVATIWSRLQPESELVSEKAMPPLPSRSASEGELAPVRIDSSSASVSPSQGLGWNGREQEMEP